MQILKQAGAGSLVPDLRREHGMSSATFYKWRVRLSSENEAIADWLIRLTTHQRNGGGFGLLGLEALTRS